MPPIIIQQRTFYSSNMKEHKSAFIRVSILSALFALSALPSLASLNQPTLTSPTTRHISQRDSNNLGSVLVSGSFPTNIPDSVEARAIVMSGPNDNGTSTSWQTIASSPGTLEFSGTLIDIPAGGWYQIEVRGHLNDIPSPVTTIEKIGIGDIFVAAGQSNSSSWSDSTTVSVSDDRVSARTSFTDNTWTKLVDPVTPGDGTGSSVWSRFANNYSSTVNLPLAIIPTGRGGSGTGEWVPGGLYYELRLKPTLQSLPQGDFRALIWHQGETDPFLSVDANTYSTRLSSTIAQSRIDAGWDIPWFVAEASWAPGSTHANQEAVVAGQRLTIHNDPLTFFSESTDDLHFDGNDIHFTADNLLDRADQLITILEGSPSITPINGDFENNRDPGISGITPVPDGTSRLIDLTSDNAARPIGWRVLSSDGLTAADGDNGILNPDSSTYLNGDDTINSGIITNMNGPHVATLQNGSPNNYFLQSTRVLAQPLTNYEFTVALGVRDDASSFGNARLEITANGIVVQSASFTKADLDTLNGLDSAGTFTDVSIDWTAPTTVGSNEPLAIRIVKESGSSTVIDFDNIRLVQTEPEPVIANPSTRHISQRDLNNLGSINISGTFPTFIPDSIEARAVVMSGPGDNGTTTSWQTISNAPGTSNFSGNLIDVPAGGWYQIEVRGLKNGISSPVATIEKVGVGDIFITSGGSNSINRSATTVAVADDRASARTSLTTSTWAKLEDPLPLSNGNGGSVWSRFANAYSSLNNLPLGIVTTGIDSSTSSQWLSSSAFYNVRLKAAIQSFPANGFRAVLWHQGEADSVTMTNAFNYAGNLISTIAESRSDAGWTIPWFVAEASWTPGSIHGNQEAIIAGQRLAIHNDPLTFFSESTDDLHFDGNDVHFTDDNLTNRANQLVAILNGTSPISVTNGQFEDNRIPGMPGVEPVTDGTSRLIDNLVENAARPIGWRVVLANGLEAADGNNGILNPSSGTYANADDSLNSGILPNMNGPHVATLQDGSPNNFFLQNTRILAKPLNTYTLTTAIGIRDDPATFGNVRIEMTANGQIVQSASFTKADLDALNGTDSAGTFTEVSIRWTSPSSVSANSPLGIRIIKESGVGTVVDFDHVRLTETPPLSQPIIVSPTTRQIVQRDSNNLGAVTISGSFPLSIPDSIEARAVVMTGPTDTGNTTDWQTITNSLTSTTFSGTLTNIPAGGWYQIEIRGILNNTPSPIATIEKIGVGDIFIVAGEMNSANSSSSTVPVLDDRVSARTSFSNSSWEKLEDPTPLSFGADGSVWSRFSNSYTSTTNLPLGIVSAGSGSATVDQWLPTDTHYDTRLLPSIQSFPPNGFRAILWHQGESDALNNTPTNVYSSHLITIIEQSRQDSGWQIPWYVAEASWVPTASHTSQEAIVAAQRLAIHNDPLVFFSESTDDLHFDGNDVFFTPDNLLNRANQLITILEGTPSLGPVNGHFEQNRTPGVSGITPLADGSAALIDASSDDALRPLGWRVLSSDGLSAADGDNGIINPTTGTYANADDSINSGVLPNMDGPHIATLQNGSPNNYFLQSTRVLAKPLTTYTLSTAIGVRDDPSSFGNARLEITANGIVVQSTSFSKVDLDALAASDSSGTFTKVSINWTTPATIDSNQPLAIRIVKELGNSTVLDFDHIELTETPVTPYQLWALTNFGSFTSLISDPDSDPDHDCLPNLIEFYLGTSPTIPNSIPEILVTHSTTDISIPLNPDADHSKFSLEYSLDLQNWFNVFSPSHPDIFASISSNTFNASFPEGERRFFYRIIAIQ